MGDKDVLTRGRPSVALDLKRPEAVAAVLDLVESADVLVEGMRPGAIERLGLGPEACHARNPRLVYGRMTGWGQDGPWSQAAGHDMNYIAITGALYGLGQDRDRPHFPGNLLGDFGGGSTYLVIGVLAALLEARTSGQGQVVDAAIVDGTAHLNAMASTFAALGLATDRGAPACSTAASLLRHLRDGRRQARQRRRAGAAVLRRPRRRASRSSCPTATTRSTSVRSAKPSPRASRSGPRLSGRRSSTAPTRAWPRSSRSPRRPTTRTSLRAARSSSTTASSSRPRRRGSRARARPSRCRPAGRRRPHPRGPGGVGCGRRRAHRQRRRDPGLSRESLPLPRHARGGRRRAAGVRRGAGGHRPARRRAHPAPARARPLGRGRPRRLVGDHPRRRPLQRHRPRRRQVGRPSAGRRPSCTTWPSRVVAADFPFLGACYGIGVLGTLAGGVVDRTYGEAIGALPVRLTARASRTRSSAAAGRCSVRTSATRRRCRGCRRGPCCWPRPTRARCTPSGWAATSTPPSSTPSSTRPHCATAVDAYSAHGYYEPHEQESLKAAAREAMVTEPVRLLGRFVELYAAAEGFVGGSRLGA